MTTKHIARLARIENRVAVCRDEVFRVYLQLLSDEDLKALLQTMGILRGSDYQPTFADWLSKPPEWAVRPDLWRAAAAQLVGYSDQVLLDAGAELVELKAANTVLKLEENS